MARRSITADDDFRVIGGMKLMKRETEVDIAQKGEWILASIDQWSHPPWRSFKLFRNRKAKKRVWHLNWNEEEQRFARGRDFRMLLEHHGEMVEWVRAKILARLAEKEEENAA